jgi:hypothetical protein
MTRPTGYRRAWIHLGTDGIDGLVVARVRCRGLVWDVRDLWIDGNQEGLALALLVAVCEEAANRGARRVFLETALGAWQLGVARAAGFVQYTQASLHACQVPGRPGAQPLPGARTRLARDEQPLFQLYTAAVPAAVRSAEALTLEEWLALHKGVRRWTPGLLANSRQLVWELDGAMVAWMNLVHDANSYHVEWLLHPSHDDAWDQLVAHSVRECGGKLPLYATCREYQVSLRSALERGSFELVGERAVFGRQLAVRVADRRLVTARARPTLGR